MTSDKFAFQLSEQIFCILEWLDIHLGFQFTLWRGKEQDHSWMNGVFWSNKSWIVQYAALHHWLSKDSNSLLENQKQWVTVDTEGNFIICISRKKKNVLFYWRFCRYTSGRKKSATLSLTALFYLNNLQETLKHQWLYSGKYKLSRFYSWISDYGEALRNSAGPFSPNHCYRQERWCCLRQLTLMRSPLNFKTEKGDLCLCVPQNDFLYVDVLMQWSGLNLIFPSSVSGILTCLHIQIHIFTFKMGFLNSQSWEKYV